MSGLFEVLQHAGICNVKSVKTESRIKLLLTRPASANLKPKMFGAFEESFTHLKEPRSLFQGTLLFYNL